MIADYLVLENKKKQTRSRRASTAEEAAEKLPVDSFVAAD
jgi:hypothetical protein